MDGSHGAQKLQAGQRTPTHGPKNASGKPGVKPGQKPGTQKGQPIKQAPAKVAATAANNKKKSKKGKHHQHDLHVTIDLVGTFCVILYLAIICKPLMLGK